MRVLFLGDIVGAPGREVLAERAKPLRAKYGADYVIANGENTAGGFGATPKLCQQLLDAPIDLLTMGNHVFARKEIEPYLDQSDRVLRPANYPDAAPGKGIAIIENEGHSPLGVINLQGTVFMTSLACPFETFDAIVDELRAKTKAIVVDFHAEATAEKAALAYYADGRCSAVIGTHTHVQTADEAILPGGTAFITDVGMTGPRPSIIGMDPVLVQRRFLMKLPTRFEVAKGDPSICGVVIDIDEESGRTHAIRRIRE